MDAAERFAYEFALKERFSWLMRTGHAREAAELLSQIAYLHERLSRFGATETLSIVEDIGRVSPAGQEVFRGWDQFVPTRAAAVSTRSTPRVDLNNRNAVFKVNR